MRFSFTMLALLATFLFTLSCAQIPRHVVVLNQDSFEKTTQASTGQTSGVWFILFNDRTHPRAGEADHAFMQLAMGEDKEFIVGEVFLNEIKSRALAWQFADVQPPSAVLFRDQKMYVYPRPLHEPNTVQKLHDFAAKAYEEVADQRVPGSIFGKKEARQVQEEWVEANSANSAFDYKTALFGIACLLVGWKVKSWAKKKKVEELLEARANAESENTPAIGGSTSEDTSEGREKNGKSKKKK